MLNNLVKNINVIINLIDVTSTTSTTTTLEYITLSQIMVLHHFIIRIIINFLSYVS